jgi:hypothetical protein
MVQKPAYKFGELAGGNKERKNPVRLPTNTTVNAPLGGGPAK